MYWLESRCWESKPEGPLQLMYGIDGRTDLTEETLDHLEGYKGSRPVRIGNGAHDQLQLDVYGELMDPSPLHKYGDLVLLVLETLLIRSTGSATTGTRGQGIWEVRATAALRVLQAHVLGTWTGAFSPDKRSFPADRDRWLKVRDEIYEEIMERGWNPSP